MAGDSHSHRPSLSQTNKKRKSRHASSRSIRDQQKGRMGPLDPAAGSQKHAKSNASLAASQKKVNRRHHAAQMKQKKIEALEDVTKLFNRKGAEKVQRVIAVVPLTNDVSAEEVVEHLLQSVGVEVQGEGGYRTGDVVKFHSQTLRFLLLPSAADPKSTFAIIDGCNAADFVLFGLSSEEEVGTQAETTLRSLTGTGVGNSGGVFGVVKNLPSAITLASSTRSSLHSFLTHFFPSLDRVHNAASSTECSTVVRSLCEKVPKGIRWREARGRVLAEKVEWVENAEGEDGEGTLVVEGVVRGGRLDANRLVHLQGLGDFKIERITAAALPNRKASRSDAMDTSAPLDDLSTPNDDADSLASTNVPDEEEFGLAEQTWPTEEEMASAPAASSSRGGDMLPPALPGTTPRLKRVPKGTSAYQAAWIIDESDDEEGEYSDEEEEQDATMGETGAADEGDDDESVMIDPRETTDDMASVSTRPFADLSPEQEEEQLQAYLADRAKERAHANKDDMDFPDEIDTPMDIAARERFARYRGLKSFRTSKWDPYEELPVDYSRCFMFEDFKTMGRKMERKAALEGVEAGTRIVLRIAKVPRAAYASYNPLLPFIVFGLLKHEHKYSVMHFTVQRNTEYDGMVRSKDPLVVQLGFRRFLINPIFSQHTVRNGGKGSNNVHKFERFLRHGINHTIATAYLPITFGNVPTVLLRVPSSESTTNRSAAWNDPSVHLVGTGSLLSSDPTRITAKRIILTGHPFKVHKKTATIRYMFFNQPDIEYYKPVQLRTKSGRTGYIKESLGTHGYFKAGFDGPIQQMDQICLTLYKRCFPKWSAVWDGGLVGAPKRGEVEEAMEDRENEQVRQRQVQFGDIEMR